MLATQPSGYLTRTLAYGIGKLFLRQSPLVHKRVKPIGNPGMKVAPRLFLPELCRSEVLEGMFLPVSYIKSFISFNLAFCNYDASVSDSVFYQFLEALQRQNISSKRVILVIGAGLLFSAVAEY